MPAGPFQGGFNNRLRILDQLMRAIWGHWRVLWVRVEWADFCIKTVDNCNVIYQCLVNGTDPSLI